MAYIPDDQVEPAKPKTPVLGSEQEILVSNILGLAEHYQISTTEAANAFYPGGSEPEDPAQCCARYTATVTLTPVSNSIRIEVAGWYLCDCVEDFHSYPRWTNITAAECVYELSMDKPLKACDPAYDRGYMGTSQCEGSGPIKCITYLTQGEIEGLIDSMYPPYWYVWNGRRNNAYFKCWIQKGFPGGLRCGNTTGGSQTWPPCDGLTPGRFEGSGWSRWSRKLMEVARDRFEMCVMAHNPQCGPAGG